MEITKITQTDWLTEAEKTIKAGLHQLIYIKVEKPVAIVHRRSQVDENLCTELGYEVAESFNNGGTILSNPGDIVVVHTNSPDNDWCNKWANYLVDRLTGKNLSAEYSENEVLVDDFKVCIMGVTRYGRIDYTLTAIGINTKLEDIQKICRKPMTKVRLTATVSR